MDIGTLLQNRYDNTADNGYSAIGRLLVGGGAREEQAFQRGAIAGATLQERMAAARMARQKEIALNGLQHTLETNGVPAGEAAIVSQIFAAGHDPHQFGQFQTDQQTLGIRGDALDAANAGNDSLMNRLIAVQAGRPLEVSRIEGNTILNPHAPITDQSFAPTSIGEAMAGNYRAEAAQHTAQAGAARALERQRDAATANGGSGDGEGARATALTSEEIQTLFGSDPKQYQTFLAYQAMTRQPNAHLAAQRYFNRVGAIDPNETPPGAITVETPAAAATPAATAAAPRADGTHGRLIRTGTRADGVRVGMYEDGTIAPLSGS